MINTLHKDSSFGRHDWANDSVIPSTTFPDIPQIPHIPDIPCIPVKIERMGWICGRCGSSNSPDILFCPKCSQQNYYYPPSINPQPNWENEIKVICKNQESGNKSMLKRLKEYDLPDLSLDLLS